MSLRTDRFAQRYQAGSGKPEPKPRAGRTLFEGGAVAGRERNPVNASSKLNGIAKWSTSQLRIFL